MARPGRPERNRAAQSFRQLRRFHHVINSDEVFGTHRARSAATNRSPAREDRNGKLRNGDRAPERPSLKNTRAANSALVARRLPNAGSKQQRGLFGPRNVSKRKREQLSAAVAARHLGRAGPQRDHRGLVPDTAPDPASTYTRLVM